MKLKTFFVSAVLVAVVGALLPTLATAREEKRPEPVTPPEGIPGLVPGRVVYYTPGAWESFKDGPVVGLIVRVFDKNAGTSNIRLLCDGSNQNPDGENEWVTSRLYDPNGAPGTWRFLR